MIVAEDLLLGLFLGASLGLLAFFLASYLRSGVRAFRPTIMGLVLHSALTVFLLSASIGTELFAGLDWWVVPLGDGIVLLLAIVLGILGGRTLERSA